MKHKITYISVLLLCCLMSCSKDPYVSEEREVEVAVSLSDKAPRSVGDDAAGTMDVLLFRDSGALQSHAKIGIYGAHLSVIKDTPLNYRAVVNAPSGLFDGVADTADFNTRIIRLADNADSFVMGASGREVFSRSTTLEMDARRYLSRVILHGIRPAFMLESARAIRRVCFVRAYLRNVPEGVHADFSPHTDGRWYNTSGMDATLAQDVRRLLVKEEGMVLEDASEIDAEITLYCCANPQPCLAQAGPREGTSLMLEFDTQTTDGNHHSCTYAIRLPAIEPNTEYVINNAVLVTPPYHGPLPEEDPVTYTVSVHPWGESRHDVELN